MDLKSWRELPEGGIIIQPGNAKENKTGSWKNKTPFIEKSRCTQCQTCARLCPENAINLNKEGEMEINNDYCKGCGICAEACPLRAIKMQ